MELNFFNLVKNYSSDYSRFYSDYSSMQIDLTVTNNVRVRLTPAINPGDKTRPTKGTARFKLEDQVVFSLSAKECYGILKNYSDVLTGKYVNPTFNEKDNKKMQGAYVVTHFKENKATKFIVEPGLNTKTNKLTGNAKISISSDGKYCSYMLREDEQYIFREFLKTHATLGTYFYEMRRAVIADLSKLAYNTLNREDDNKENKYNNNNNNNNKNYSNNKPRQEESYSTFDDSNDPLDEYENKKKANNNKPRQEEESDDIFNEEDIFNSGI